LAYVCLIDDLEPNGRRQKGPFNLSNIRLPMRALFDQQSKERGAKVAPLLKRHACTVGKDLRGHVSNGQAVNQAFVDPQVNEHAQLLCLEEAEQEVAEEEEVRAQGGEPTPGS